MLDVRRETRRVARRVLDVRRETRRVLKERFWELLGMRSFNKFGGSFGVGGLGRRRSNLRLKMGSATQATWLSYRRSTRPIGFRPELNCGS